MEYYTIPIIKESYLPGNSAYLYGIAAAEAALDQGTVFNKARLSTVVFQYDSAVFRRKGVDYGVSKQTLNRFEDTYPTPVMLTSDFIVMMSSKAWLCLNEWFLKDNLPTRTRSTYTRVYFYFYYWITAHHGQYMRPFVQIVADISINKNKLTEAIDWLCGHKLLCHTNYTFNNRENRARIFFLPVALWPDILNERLIEQRRIE